MAAASGHLSKISTLYLGGGTPSMLSPKHLTELFEGLHAELTLDDTHITMEANPATFEDSKSRTLQIPRREPCVAWHSIVHPPRP